MLMRCLALSCAQDESGQISPHEFRESLKALDIQMEEAEVELLIKAFDEGGDGEIDCQEMIRRLECAMP